MIDTESLDRFEPAPGNLMVGQVQGNARIEIVRVERGALPIREGAVALDGSTEAGNEVRGQRSANADRDRSAIGHESPRSSGGGSACGRTTGDVVGQIGR